jgi:hypothetical protein
MAFMRRIHGLQIQPVLLEPTDAGAGWFCLHGRICDALPVPIDFGLIFGGRIDRPVSLRQSVHDIVNRCERIPDIIEVPACERIHVMAGLCLGLGSSDHRKFVSDRRNEIDVDVDLVLLRPRFDLPSRNVIVYGHETVGEGEREFPCCPRSPDVHKRQQAARNRSLY